MFDGLQTPIYVYSDQLICTINPGEIGVVFTNLAIPNWGGTTLWGCDANVWLKICEYYITKPLEATMKC